MDDFDLTYEHWLSSQEFTVWDLLSDDNSLSSHDCLQHIKPKKPSIVPYVKFVDLNNSADQPCVNTPKPAIEIGIKGTF